MVNDGLNEQVQNCNDLLDKDTLEMLVIEDERENGMVKEGEKMIIMMTFFFLLVVND